MQGTAGTHPHFAQAMVRYRFVTPHRRGKWYTDLQTAKRFACKIGAGFLARRSGEFVAYSGTELETMQIPDSGAAGS